jgi:uncharacterized membrane protein
MIRGDVLREYTRGSLWVLPTACVLVALVAGVLLSRVNVGPDSPLAFQGTADDARTLLISITSTMVTVIALLLGLAVVALQLSSTQFSPRLLRNFLRDRPNQLVLGVFVGTFAYSAAGLFTVGVSGGQRSDQFPRFAISVAMVLLFVSLALLVFFADHLAHSLQVDNIMRVVERSVLPVIHDLPEPDAGAEAPEVPATALAVPARTSGYVQVVYVENLVATAAARDVHVRLRPRIGEHVVAGAPLAWVWPVSPGCPDPDPKAFAAVLARTVRVGFERTLEQDPGFGLRQLVDAACKALSPAVNDPYTAVQAIDHLAVLFSALATRPLGDHVARDTAGTTTVTVPGRSFANHLAWGVGLIRRYGASEPTVAQALLDMLSTTLTATASPERWTAIEEQASLIVADAEREVVQPADLALVHAAADGLARALADRRAGLTGLEHLLAAPHVPVAKDERSPTRVVGPEVRR